MLEYFKYTNFLIDNLNTLFGLSAQAQAIILPLAISFFTFQQVAYLIDCYRKEAVERDFLSYCLFVSFFPQLIAGPIVHHKEMMPQFARMAAHPNWNANVSVGITLFIIGLFKKTVLADNFAVYANWLFDSPSTVDLHIGDAWIGALAYHFQIYFDFSGYSDMAIGLGYMFGIVLPINFNSPYKARSIIDFWRRWHMTLSRFLRDYLYISFGGNRKGKTRRYINLLATMLLGGLWHGAAWTFVVWGGLHGAYLILNRAWLALRTKLGLGGIDKNRIYISASILCTSIAVVVAWVYFRSTDVDAANRVVLAMFGYGEKGLSVPYSLFLMKNSCFGSFFSLFLDKLFFNLVMMLSYPATIFFILALPNAGQLVNIIEHRGRLQWSSNSHQAGHGLQAAHLCCIAYSLVCLVSVS